jgi:chemotaxis protein MotB
MEEDGPIEEAEEGLPAWVMTFADLMSLLMCFFVLLLSFSEMDVLKFRQIAGSMKSAFGVQKQITAPEIPKGTSIIKQEYSPGKPEPTLIKVIQQETIDIVRDNLKTIDPVTEEVEELVEKLIDAMGAEIEQGKLEIVIDGERLLVRINQQGSFKSGSAQLHKKFGVVLNKLTHVLNESNGEIIVAGHTDNIPIKTLQYPSNWILSAARAASVVHYITHHGLQHAQRIQIRAHADTKPLVPNISRKNRAKNRRIEIDIDTHTDSKNTQGGHPTTKTLTKKASPKPLTRQANKTAKR